MPNSFARWLNSFSHPPWGNAGFVLKRIVMLEGGVV